MNQKRSETIGRPSLLESDEVTIIEAFVHDSFASNQPADYASLTDFIFDKFQKSISIDTLAHILKRSEAIKIIKGIPLESVRAEVPFNIIKDYYERLSLMLESEDIPPAFYFNVDETGFHDYVDAREKKLIVPASYSSDTKCFSVSRSSKRATLVACIALDGTSLKPLVISPNKTIEEKLNAKGYHDENCVIISQDNGFVNKESFAHWADVIFFPEVRRRRIKYKYEGTVILSLDGCTAHFSDYFLDECTYHGVFPFPEPPGTSDQIQPLDLGLFSAQKAIKARLQNHKDVCENTNNIIKIIDSWQKCATPSNIVSAFRQAGIYAEPGNEGLRTRASLDFARSVRDNEGKKPFPELMEKNKMRKLPHF